MFELIVEQLKANPLLAGGIGTVAFGSVMYAIRAIPRAIFRTIKRLLTIEVTLTSQSHLYHEFLDVLSRHRIGALARNYTTDHKGAVGAGYGESFAWFNGRFVVFNRSIMEDKNQLSEKLTVTVFSRNVAILHALADAARAPRRDNRIQIWEGCGTYWQAQTRKPPRSLDTVFANNETKQEIIARIEWFLANEDWYRQRGIPYKLVILLHGQPGTGKTSLIFGLASHFKRSLATLSSLTSIDRLLAAVPDNSFAVAEDIDMMTTSRDASETVQEAAPGQPSAVGSAAQGKPKGIDDLMASFELNSLQRLINTLDGIATPHGIIVFITTNFRNRLDSALIRPGRVDLDKEVGPLDPFATEAMFCAFYGEAQRGLIRDYTGSPEFRRRPGSDLQLLFMTESPETAVERLRLPQRPHLEVIDGNKAAQAHGH